jgi:GNAT superfamily N-acetyltransferase
MTHARITVRPFEQEHASDCSGILIAALSGLEAMDHASRAMIASHATPAVLGAELARYFTLVGLDGGNLVAFGALDGDEVKRVYVHPRHQGKGFGTAVMRELEREARRRGLDIVRVTAGAEAAAFYERLGYARLGAGEFVSGPARVPFLTMQKDLRSDR